jgi:transmembrane sensor
MDEVDRISHLLNRYLNNTCTRQEMDELLDYIQKFPEDERLRAVLQDSWNTEKSFDDSEDSAWRDMEKRMHDLSVNETFLIKEEMMYKAGIFWKAAACFLAVAACFAGFFFLVENKAAPFAEIQPSPEHSVITPNDEHRLVVLPDGSKVWINGNSKLTSAPAFNDKTREVTLHGEAFFDIRHDPGRPFIITTGKVKTTVLGTAFNIRAFPGEKAVTVTVTRGKVLVEAENNKGGMITANQQITLDLPSEQLEAHTVDAEAVSQWIKDDLVLYNITLGEVEEILEERYSVDIRFDNTVLKNCRFTSTFFQHASLDEVLTAICLVNGAAHEIHDQVITIYGKGCNQ